MASPLVSLGVDLDVDPTLVQALLLVLERNPENGEIIQPWVNVYLPNGVVLRTKGTMDEVRDKLWPADPATCESCNIRHDGTHEMGCPNRV